ncbi:FxLYD domain-containing protein [Pseudomonas sp. MF6747]|uniref:FxLYD domain-containing protein n=1 Tax=Pseudomonas sp. MF6747 TaxID=2797527 RepID=UPI00190A08CC|nr:FxLYD domain-containing protein [Pseudomonas sp. MF6747]MBK3510731.1 hypothetical protein [Pseudomonas sp. MF6747]
MRVFLASILLIFSGYLFADNRLQVDTFEVKTYADGKVVEGIARNTSSQNLGSVYVKFKLYDSGGAVVGTAIDNGSNIGPGEKWKFSAIPDTPSFSKVQFSEVTIY